ncbi:hypothetical protein F7Q99_22565 [Streptomyces kaniharaensis]|uniref:Lipoprotein n=1 Tax=Streptomyces kaniharaensis TaxID=212423 RepID=A0A6N7KWH9_9ACTN|nr:hypothetical protein [Streptomyces kaniharaensis]MQS14969.1 hypothetical protein [Streptomyces kaniharaensis]
MFKSAIGRAVRPALLTLVLTGVAACGPTSSGTPQAAAGTDPAATPVAAAATGTGPAAAQSSGTPHARATTPGSAPTSARPTASVTVTAAPAGVQQAAIGTPGKDGGAVTATAKNLQLTAYDPAGGTAVLSAAQASTASPTATPTATPSATPSTTPSVTASATASATPSGAQAVQPGALIASPPTAAAPQGALVAVTSVQQGAGDTIKLATRPATIAELLGGTEADGKVAVDPHNIKVTPLVKDLKASIGKDNGGVKADASGTLEVDVNAPIPLPEGASVAASGSLQLHPAVHFAYHGASAGSPRTASIGFDLGAHAQWKVSGDLARNTGAAPIRLPFAKLQASPVLTVAGLPVVVNLGLTCYLEIGADGQIHVEAEQEATGTWAVRADYTGGKGWAPITDASDTKVSPVHLRLSGKASVRASLGAEASIGLYDTVGVETTVAPYLSAKAEGSLTADVPGGAPQAQGSWSVVGGIDLNGALTAHLKIFGTPIIEGKLPLPAFHREWPLLTGSGAIPAPRPSS